MRAMPAQGNGSIVNLFSIAGQVGIAGAPFTQPPGMRWGGLTKSAAFGVRVNAVPPTPVATDMLARFVGQDEAAKTGFPGSIPAKRAATVDEITETIVFIASTKAPYLTGQSIAVDGGYTAQ